MRVPIQVVRHFARGPIAVVFPLLVAFSLAFTGCATREEVAEIVARSNAAMLGGQFGLPDPNRNGGEPAWQTESDRIEAFIAAHPNREATTAPLRVRQAMLLLTHRQFGLAEVAFNRVHETNLFAARDQALHRNRSTLLWWFVNGTNPTWTATDRTEATNALGRLKEEQARLADSPEIRDYLAEMRAWIGLTAARHSTAAGPMRARLEDALDVYSETFGENDLKALSDGTEDKPEPEASSADVRRRLRAGAVLESARELNLQRSLGAQPRDAVFRERIQRPEVP